MITNKATLVFQALRTLKLRAKASEIARNHGLLRGTTVHTLGLAQLLKDEGITETFQEFYAQALVAFYDYATTHFHIGNPSISMLDDLVRGKRILWDNYK